MTAAQPNPDLLRGFVIQTADDDPTTQPAKVLYIGRPKVGKTQLLTSWNASSDDPTQPGLFVIAFDKNLETLRAVRPKVPFVAIDTREQLVNKVLPYILNGGLAKDWPSVRAVGLDSLSFYANQLSNELAQGGKEVDWQLFAARISNDLGQFTRLANPNAGLPQQYHWVATCHEKDRYTTRRTAGGQRERHLEGTEPAISGQMAALVTGFFDLVLYPTREVKGVEVKPGQYESQAVFECRAMEPVGHKAPAGGTLWGKSITGAVVDGTYQGLRKLCAQGSEG